MIPFFVDADVGTAETVAAAAQPGGGAGVGTGRRRRDDVRRRWTALLGAGKSEVRKSWFPSWSELFLVVRYSRWAATICAATATAGRRRRGPCCTSARRLPACGWPPAAPSACRTAPIRSTWSRWRCGTAAASTTPPSQYRLWPKTSIRFLEEPSFLVFFFLMVEPAPSFLLIFVSLVLPRFT